MFVVAERDYCVSEQVNLACSHGEILMFGPSLLGRMREDSRCVQTIEGIGCQTDVTSHVKEFCMGHRNCSFDVFKFMRIAEPCQDYTPYLSLSYYCKKGTNSSTCRT